MPLWGCRFFQYEEEGRQARRIRKAELKEIGRQEALKRGKHLDEHGKVSARPLSDIDAKSVQ